MEKLIGEYKIAFTKGDTYALAIKFKNITEELRFAFFTVKENADDEPLIQKSLGAGIEKIDDRAYKNEKTYKLQIQAGDTIFLEPRVQYLYDLQVTVDNVVKTVLSGVFTVMQTVTGMSGATTETLEIAVDDTLEVEVETTSATNGIEYETDPVANAKIGDMTTLDTTAKGTLVQAINEAHNGAKTNEARLIDIMSGATAVPESTHATNADNADSARHATSATYATNADTANRASEADNALSVNGVYITSENGIIKVSENGVNIIIPQKKLLWSGEETVASGSQGWIYLTTDKMENGDIIEVCYNVGGSGAIHYKKFKINSDLRADDVSRTVTVVLLEVEAITQNGTTSVKGGGTISITSNHQLKIIPLNDKSLTIYSIYKIIE